MKYLLLTIYAFFLLHGTGQDLIITDPILVATDFGNYHPQIEVTNDNRANISWTDPGAHNAYFAKHNGFDGFSAPVQLNPAGLDVASYSWSGPDFTYEGDNIYAVFQGQNNQSYLVKSIDNGLSFGDTVRIASEGSHSPVYPDVAVLNDTVYATFMNHEDESWSSPDYVLARSIDGGESFENFVIASEILSDEVCDCCPPEIIVNENYVIIYFRNNDDNIRDIKAVVSYDRGESFTDWYSVDEHEWNIMACPSTGPDARFIDDEIVVSIYKSYFDGGAKVYFNATNVFSGTNLHTEVMEAAGSSNLQVNYPQLTVDDGMIGAVWEGAGDGTSIDVFFNRTSTTELDFNPDNAVNLTPISGVQSKPDIALKNGVYNIVYANSTDGNLYYLQVGEASGIVEEASDFRVYPTQITDLLSINVGQPGLIEILALNGERIYEGPISSSLIINTCDWSNGVYFVRILQGGKVGTAQVVK